MYRRLVLKRIMMLAMILLVASCIEPFSLENIISEPILVIEGIITDKPGPYEVKIFYSYVPDSMLSNYLPESEAIVSIHDNLGNFEVLNEVRPGVYNTSVTGIQGVVGRDYFVKIKTTKGEVYESTPDKMEPNGALDSVYFEYSSTPIVNPDPNSLVDSNLEGFTIYANAHGISNGLNYFRWTWEGTYKIQTSPELRYTHILYPNGREADIPDPVPCSGYRSVNTTQLQKDGPCTCCTCWVNEYEKNPFISDNQLVANNRFTRLNLAFIKITNEHFYEKYHVNVQQRSLTKNALDFWRAIKAQKDGATSLFQPPSGKIIGNIISKDGNEKPLGIFYASSISEKTIEILPINVPSPNSLDYMNPGATNKNRRKYYVSCLDYPNSSTDRPIFWK